jgi:uncharacterized protein (DUF1800 family)
MARRPTCVEIPLVADIADIAHLLRRTEFIVKPDRLAALVALPTREAAVDDVVRIALNGAVQMDPYLLSQDTANGYGQYTYACNWWVERMKTAPRALQEKMTLFWHGHFTSSWNEVDKGFQLMVQNQLYRTNALGNLTTLTQAMAVDPAMLVYLSNADNVKGQPNQNFARELMELFTLGVGNYTEDDVNTSARAWTGYNYNRTTLQYGYVDAKHDATPGPFFGVTKAWTGPQIIDAILTVKRATVAAFIVKELWEFFAYVGPAQNIVTDLAAVFVANNLELAPLLTALLKRPEFYSDTAKQGLVRSPIEYLVAISYYSGVSATDLGAAWRLDSTGQSMYKPPNVAGWKPNGYWLNTSAVSGRTGFADSAASHLSDGTTNDALGVSGTNTKLADANTAVDKVSAMFGLTAAQGRDMTAVTRQALVNWHTTEPNSFWRKRNLLFMAMSCAEMNMA